MNLNKFFIIILFNFFLISNTEAQIVTDRPDQTESSATVGAGNLQIETGVLIAFESSSPVSSRQILAPTTLFRFGISRVFELRLLSQYETYKRGEVSFQGISDFELGTKIQIFDDETVNTQIAFLTHIIFPSGTNEFSYDEFGTINKLSISHSLSETIGLGYNLGYNNYFYNGDGELTYSAALGVAVNDKVGIYIEPYGEYDIEWDEFVMNYDAGLTYLANDNLQFDFSFGSGITDKSNYISVGLSWLLEKE